MPTPMALRTSNVAFVPASRLAPPDLGPLAAPTPNAAPAAPAAAAAPGDAPTGPVAFRPAGAVNLDAILDRFEPAAPASAPPAPASTGPEKLDRPVLLFNGQCETCKVLSSWVKQKDASGKDLIDERPIPSTPEELARLNPDLDIWKVYEEIHLLMPDGSVKKGGEAIAEVLKRLPGQGWYTWAFDVSVFGFKPGMLALEGAYKLLDAIRPALGCSSCGGGPVAWWAKPIKWTADAVKWLMGKGKDDAHAAPQAG